MTDLRVRSDELRGRIYGYHDHSRPGGHSHRRNYQYSCIPTQFKNEPSIDFSNPDNARKMRAAIEKVRNELGREYDLVIGGRRVKTAEETPVDQSGEAVGGCRHSPGSRAAEVEPAMQAALKAFETWSRTLDRRAHQPAVPRSRRCCASASLSSMAWLVFEVGKNYAEADGDIAELIDFCRFLCPGGAASRRRRPLRCSCRASTISSATFRSAWAR